jgi:hypothetical protein
MVMVMVLLLLLLLMMIQLFPNAQIPFIFRGHSKWN